MLLIQMISQDNKIQEYKTEEEICFTEKSLIINGKEIMIDKGMKVKIIEQPLLSVKSFKEASEQCGIAPSTLRMLAKNKDNHLDQATELRKSGGTWLITNKLLNRKYAK